MANVKRFWDKVDKSGECWNWTASRNECGYGHFRVGRQSGGIQKAHRVTWELTHRPIPDGMCVCHRCDNPGCVNPAHLFLGTHADNMADKVEKGRSVVNVGETNGRAKLSEADVVAIRADTRPQAIIAAQYGISRPSVSKIRLGRTWGHVE